MGNMSYCMFENTLRDLRECAERMDELLSAEEQSIRLSESEERARKALVTLCRRIARDHET